jgi:hypothetical protein
MLRHWRTSVSTLLVAVLALTGVALATPNASAATTTTEFSAPQTRFYYYKDPWVAVGATLTFSESGEPVSQYYSYNSVALLRRTSSSAEWQEVVRGDIGTDGAVELSGEATASTDEFMLRYDGWYDVADPADSAVVSPVQRSTEVTFSAPSEVAYGSTFIVIAHVDVRGDPEAGGVPVRLQRKLHGGDWTTYEDGETDYDGNVWFQSVTAPRNAAFRALAVATLGSGAGQSGEGVVGVRPVVSSQGVSPVMIPRAGTSTFTARIPALPAGTSVNIQRYVGGAWKTVASRTVDSTHRVHYGTQPTTLGAYRYRVQRGGSTSSMFLGFAGKKRELDVVVHGPGSTSSHRFELVAGGQPVRWWPCRAIRYRLNLTYAPAGAKADVRESLRRVTQITGLRFDYLGTTSYLPRIDLRNQPAPFVIAWTPKDPRDPSQSWKGAATSTLGIGGYSPGEYRKGRPWFDEGYVAMNSWSRLAAGFGAGKTVGALLQHELGHALGLAHVGATSQLMYDSQVSSRVAGIYGAGDYTGLKKVGRHPGECS